MVQFKEEAHFLPEICVGVECNNACLFCAVGGNWSKEFPTKSLEEIKDELKNLRAVGSDIRITGGEPTIRHDIIDIVSHARDLGFKQISIETNGRRLHDSEFLKGLLDAGANHFFVSIHGHRAEIHDRVTCTPGSFRKTVGGIRNLSESPAYFGINVVITGLNYRNVPEIAGFLRGITNAHIALNFITVHGSALLNREIVPRMSEAVPYMKKAIDSLESDKDIVIGHIPFCFLGDYVRYSNFVRFPVIKRIFNPTFRITLESHMEWSIQKSEVCRECRFDRFCHGLWKEYAKIHGYGELRPVPGKRISSMEELKSIMDSAGGGLGEIQ